MLRDARFALRLFARRPGVAVLIVFTLSIGIAATTVGFSVADAILAVTLVLLVASGLLADPETFFAVTAALAAAAHRRVLSGAQRQPDRSQRDIAVRVAAFVQSPPDRAILLAWRFGWNCC